VKGKALQDARYWLVPCCAMLHQLTIQHSYASRTVSQYVPNLNYIGKEVIMAKVKDGLYYKKIKNGRVSVSGKQFHIPLNYQYVFVEVSGKNVYLCNIHGNRIVQLTPANDGVMRVAL